MKVAILTNDDLTGSLIFSPLLREKEKFQVVSVVLSESPVKGRGNAFSSVLSLARKMSLRYWLFLVFVNGLFHIFARCWSGKRAKLCSAQIAPIRGLARALDTELLTVADFNDPGLRQYLMDQKIDLLLIRVSTLLKSDLLSVPRLGTWCVHSSLLPAYGGIAGEFHALRQGETRIGSTVFSVTEKLDDGPPLGQIAFATHPRHSLYSHIVANNQAASKLLCNMVIRQAHGVPAYDYLFNAEIEPSYFSWPQRSDLRQFRKHGRYLISASEILDLLRLNFDQSFRRGRGVYAIQDLLPGKEDDETL